MRYCHLAGAVLLFSAGGSFAQLPQAPSENAPIANTSTTAAGPQSSPAGFTGSTQKFADLNFRCPPLPSEMLCAENGFAGDHHTEHQPEGFHWGRALAESFTFLAIEQAYVVHTDFRWVVSENGIPFNHYWRDYKQSLSAWVHSGWSDGDPNLFGYVGHPIPGALSSYIDIQNDPKSATLEFSNTRRYWRSRLKATIWNAVYSTQWNLGPISEVTVEKYGAKIRPPCSRPSSTRRPPSPTSTARSGAVGRHVAESGDSDGRNSLMPPRCHAKDFQSPTAEQSAAIGLSPAPPRPTPSSPLRSFPGGAKTRDAGRRFPGSAPFPGTSRPASPPE